MKANYRPISLLSVPGKRFEDQICKCKDDHIELMVPQHPSSGASKKLNLRKAYLYI